MRNYYRLMLGQKSMHADAAFEGGFIGADYGIREDLSGQFPDDWREFNRACIPIYLELRPNKSKVAAGLACGALWTVGKGIQIGDVIMAPDGRGGYRFRKVTGDYQYVSEGVLPHRRPVDWLPTVVDRSALSVELKNSAGSAGTVSTITKHADEIEQLLSGIEAPRLIATDQSIEDPSSFALEKHLEDFLVENWSSTELGSKYDIFQDEGELVGQQYLTDTGPIDILAVSRDRKTLLVIELKKGRASDAVVGQILRYMGYVTEQLAEPGQVVKGIIIALEDDLKLRRALSLVPSVEFFRYQISFRLMKA
ncbi:MAG: DUF1016 family protein [Chloroflexi bacterium]|nr:DUF1016 family protein [Chloroflexota bacterium]